MADGKQQGMCGIIGIVGTRRGRRRGSCDGLRRLEYRGYDSAGICTILDGRLDRRRAEGKLDNLAARARPTSRCPGTIGIAHTRWATHGAPTVGQRPSARRRRRRARPQRHHREFQAAARGDCRPRAASSRARPTPRSSPISSPTSSARARSPRDAVADGAAAAPRRLRARDPVPRPSRACSIGARLGAPLTVGYGEQRELSRLGRARARAAHPAHRLSRRGRLGRGHAATGSRFSTATTSPSTREIVEFGRLRPRASTRATIAISC